MGEELGRQRKQVVAGNELVLTTDRGMRVEEKTSERWDQRLWGKMEAAFPQC